MRLIDQEEARIAARNSFRNEDKTPVLIFDAESSKEHEALDELAEKHGLEAIDAPMVDEFAVVGAKAKLTALMRDVKKQPLLDQKPMRAKRFQL